MFSASNCSKKNLTSEKDSTSVKDSTKKEYNYYEYCGADYYEYYREDLDDLMAELPWLKEIIDRNRQRFQREHTRIYLCTYKDGIGFLVEYCVECLDAGQMLTSWDGKWLCEMHGFAGDPCTEYEITNVKLIYEITNSSCK